MSKISSPPSSLALMSKVGRAKSPASEDPVPVHIQLLERDGRWRFPSQEAVLLLQALAEAEALQVAEVEAGAISSPSMDSGALL